MKLSRSLFAQIAAHPKFPWLIVALTMAGSAWLYFGNAPPGFAINVLAVVMAVITFFQLTPYQKAALICLCGVLFWIESSAISRDRSDQERQHVADQKALNERFNTILANNRENLKSILTSSQHQFEATQSRFTGIFNADKDIKSASIENLLNLTGGDSFTYIAPQPPDSEGNVQLAVWNTGKYTLTGVNLTIRRVTEWPWTTEVVDVGTIAPHQPRNISFKITPKIGSEGTDSYWIFASAQNGIEQELLQFRPSHIPGGWATQISVQTTQAPCEILRQEWTHKTKLFGTTYWIPWTDSDDFKHVTEKSDAWRRVHTLPLQPASLKYPGGCIP
jgi:hypothetical protein